MGGGEAAVSFAVLTSMDNLHPPQLPSLGAKTLVEGVGVSQLSLGGGEWQPGCILSPISSLLCDSRPLFSLSELKSPHL